MKKKSLLTCASVIASLALTQSAGAQDAEASLAAETTTEISAPIAAQLVLFAAEDAMKKGDVDEAQRLLESFLDQFPDFPLLRFRLAEIYALNRENSRSLEQLAIVRSQAPSEQDREFVDQTIANITPRPEIINEVNFSLTPSNNVNNASDAKTQPFIFGSEIPIPKELQPQFGWRANLGVTSTAYIPIRDHFDSITTIGAQVWRYSVDTLDYSTLNLRQTLRYTDAKNQWNSGIFMNRFLGDGKVYQTSFDGKTSIAKVIDRDEDYMETGFSTSFSRNIDRQNQIRAGYEYTQRYYDDQDEYYALNSYQHSFNLGWKYTISTTDQIDISLGKDLFTRWGARKDWRSSGNYNGTSVGLQWSHIYDNTIQLGLGTSYGRKDYSELYPATNYKREDEIWRYNIRALNANWRIGDNIPVLSCEYEDQSSNVKTEEYNGFSCGISLQQNF